MEFENPPRLQPSPDQSALITDRRTPASLVWFWIVFGMLTMAGAVVSLYASTVFVMSSDGCLGGGTGWLCSAGGQMIAVVVPLIGWSLAIGASLLGLGFRRRYDSAPWLGLLAGGVLYFLILGVEFAAVVSG